jgi:hypothetical protein
MLAVDYSQSKAVAVLSAMARAGRLGSDGSRRIRISAGQLQSGHEAFVEIAWALVTGGRSFALAVCPDEIDADDLLPFAEISADLTITAMRVLMRIPSGPP